MAVNYLSPKGILFMFEYIQKAAFAGIGAGAVTLDLAESALEYLVARGKITAEEARSAAKQIVEQSRKQSEEARQQMKDRLSEAFARANLVTQDRVQLLEERFKALEEKVFGPQRLRPALLVEAAFPRDWGIPHFSAGGPLPTTNRPLSGNCLDHRRLRFR
jgi:polyhydroxyalkanoate synthesis regulator phasin